MHKEVYLNPTSPYARLKATLDSLAQKAERGSSKTISVETSFGSAEVASRIPESDLATWAAGLKHHATDHRYYEITHDSLGDQFEHYYLLLKDHAGTTRAIQPFLMVNQDLITGMPDTVKRLADRIRRRFPTFLVMRMLMVGCSAGEGHLVRDPLSGNDKWVSRALRDALRPVARRLKAGMIVLKDFPKTYRKSLRTLRKIGFTRLPSMPGSRLDLNFKDFEEYLKTKLSHKTRKNLRQKYRKVAAGSPITMQVVTDIEPYIEEVYPLYRQVVERSRYKFEELTKPYFVDLGKKMGDRCVYFIWRQDGKAVAFSSCFSHNGILRDHYIGLDYTVALDHHLYFVTFRDIVVWSLENKHHGYYSAPLNYEPKYHLRHDLVPLDLYVRAVSDLLNPIFSLILPYMEPTRYDPMIRRFANAHELW